MKEYYAGKGKELNTYVLQHQKPCFTDVLFNYVKTKGIPLKIVLKNSNMDRRFVSKFKNINYKPSKMTVLALCIGLRLTIEEASTY